MAEFKLGRIRFVWKGEWSSSNTYYQDDVVSLGGKVYICVVGHESASDFFTDLDIVPSKWNLVSDGQTWKGEWNSGDKYVYNDIVSYGPRLYICNTIHTSAADSVDGLEADLEKWDIFAEGLDYRGPWTPSTKYLINEIVKYGGSTYVCTAIHTSTSTVADGLEADSANWQIFNQGLEYRSDWSSGTRYRVNDVVRYGASLWISLEPHTASSAFQTDSAKWEKFVEGFQYENEWSPYTEYQQGDIVSYGGNNYISKTNHTNAVPTTDTDTWDLFSQGINFVGDWGEDSSAFDYRVGDLVRHGGFTYICTADHQNQQPPNGAYWQKFNSGFEWRGEWIDDQEYKEGDVVRYGDNSYVCVLGHISEGDDFSSIGGPQGGGNEGSRPDLADSGQYWSIIAVGTEQSVLTTKGDLVYYSGSAPTRLPIGEVGQILSVSNDGLPSWEFLGDADDVYYVAEHGVNSPAPLYGKSIDRPWKSIRYAAQQVELGTKNADAAKLLELNRRFIQREAVEWTDYQITNNIAPFVSGFDFNSAKCERDIGLIIDAVIWDIKHGGNVRSREAALAYVNQGSILYTTGQEDETIASISYALSIIDCVFGQFAPDNNYQTLNGDNSTAVVEQYLNSNLTVESGLFTTVTNLVEIITDAISEGTDRNIPARDINTTLIRVSTGKYNEVLPIIVPAECCIMGDELRSTNVQPRKESNGTLTPKGDVKYSFTGLQRMEQIVGDIVTGTAVTKTTGNNEVQDQSWPYAETDVVGPQVEKLSRTIARQIDRRVGDKLEAHLPAAYDLQTAELGYARDQILANKEFLKAEVEAFLDESYGNLYYSRTKCKQDIGFIIDAVAYDLSYGGNWQSVNAGRAYYQGTNLQIDSTEKAATLAAYNLLKSMMQTVARGILVDPVYQDELVEADVTTVSKPQIQLTNNGTGTESTTIGNLLDDIIDIIDNGTTAIGTTVTLTYPTVATGSTGETALTITESTNSLMQEIQEETIDFINKNFGSFKYNSATCRRDLRNILTDTAYDVALGTNYNAVFNGLAYQRPTNAYNLQTQRVETIGAIRFARDEVADELTDATAETRSNAAFNEIVDIINNGAGNADALSYPAPGVLPTSNADDAYANLAANKTFIQAELVAWIDDQINLNTVVTPNPTSIWYQFSYNSDKCSRDTGFIVEAMKYDVIYGGTMAATRIAESYFGINGDAYPAGQAEQTAAAYAQLATVLSDIVQENTVTPSPGNAETQTTLGSPATATEGTVMTDNMQIIEDVITAGNLDSMPAAVYPDLAALGVSGTLQTEKTAIDDAQAQIVLDTIQFITNTYNDFIYDHAKCSRDIQIIAESAIYDYYLETNYAGIVAALSYIRAPSSKVLGDQKDATLAANEFAKQKLLGFYDTLAGVKGHPEVIIGIRNTWEWIDDILLSSNPEGGNSQVEDQEVYNALRMLELNRDFIRSEILAYVDREFSAPVSGTNSVSGTLVVSDTGWLEENQAIRFKEPQDSSGVVSQAGLVADQTYYVKEIVSDTEFTVSETVGGTRVSLIQEGSGFNFDHNKCRRDTGYIIDGVKYDITLNTNYNQVAFAREYYKAYSSEVINYQLTETVAGINYAKGLAAALPNVKADSTALSRSNAAFDEIIDILQNGLGNADAITFNAPSTATTGEQNAALQLQANKAFIQSELIEWITQNYPALSYVQADKERDIGYLVDALTFDILYGGTTATEQHIKTYFVDGANVLPASEQEPTRLAYNYFSTFVDNIVLDDTAGWTKLSAGTQDVSNGAGTSTEATRSSDLVSYVVDDLNNGSPSETRARTYPDVTSATDPVREAQIDMIVNKEKIIKETIRYLDETYSGIFTAETAYDYNMSLCQRDVNEYIDAVKWDMTYPRMWKREYTDNITLYRPGSYKTQLAARYYANAVLGSQEEDMYYLRNGTGLRLQTLDGLKGDLGPANEYGTRRPTAGAYASLDPGWGPDDERVWITARSPYVQNLTTFGYAATGQRIDGALHNGGNDSIVSNDFTQVISDGIGAHILNNGRAELVSVFTYYSHIGYLAETGGRVRATNGNNSYGTFGSAAEGVDPDEVPVTGVVDNRTQYNATIAAVNTDNDVLLNVEYSHAGNEYTEALLEIFGAGDNEEVIADEFRDGAVTQVRITETENITAGGSGYLLVTNTAQGGTASSITLSATDGNLSTAYPGMRIQITGGAGIGAYGIIDTYNAGTKVATVIRESDGAAGFDHVVPGFSFTTPNSTSVYLIEPYISFTAPTYSNSSITLPSSDTWTDVKYVETSGEYINVSASSESDGTGATFDVIRNGSKYYIEINTGGSGYQRLDTLSIHGDSVGGDIGPNDITVTVTTINEATGGIIDFDFEGLGKKGLFLATSSSTPTALSDDGETWSAGSLPSPNAGSWSKIASGLIDDGSSTFKPHSVVVVANGDDNIAYSGSATLGTGQWNTVQLPGTFNATGNLNIAFGQKDAITSRFVIISDTDSDVLISDNGGATWISTGNAIGATGFDSIAWGAGIFVALASGGTTGAWSEDGVTWTAITLPGTIASTNDITWGNGRFVALGGTNGIMYSLDGKTWTENSLTLPLNVADKRLAYGQGMFVLTSDDTDQIMYSQDGLYWQAYTLGAAITGGFNAAAFGNPSQDGRFVLLPANAGTGGFIAKIGATARARAAVASEKVFEIRLYEPGSGYTVAPTMTITDPNNIDETPFAVRLGNGALGNPTFANRGSGFTAATADINDQNSNGYADFFQDGNFIAVRRLTERPVPGSNVVFGSLPGQFFKLVNVVSFIGQNDGSYTAFLQVSPNMSINNAPADGDSVTMRIRFSQVRLTGHDFLDIGTGNFTDTNYPFEPVNVPVQANETVNSNGGRVFFTATDQDGNFRVGDLFSIEQSTGVATLNAEAFNIAGLQELTLGEVTLGGNSASVSEFSTDPFFTANSDSVVPTQRAVKAYIEAQIGGGGASLVVNSVTAGDVFIGTNLITTVTGLPININANVVFNGTVLGYPLAYQYFLK